jgi:hypothetical protein
MDALKKTLELEDCSTDSAEHAFKGRVHVRSRWWSTLHESLRSLKKHSFLVSDQRKEKVENKH